MDEESFDNYTYDLGVRIYDLVKKEVQLYSPDTVNLSPATDAEIDNITGSIKATLLGVAEGEEI